MMQKVLKFEELSCRTTDAVELKKLLFIPFPMKDSRPSLKLLKFKENGLDVLRMAKNYKDLANAESVLKNWLGPLIVPITGRDLIKDLVFNWKSPCGLQDYTDLYVTTLEEEKADERQSTAPTVLAAAVIRAFEKNKLVI